MKDEFDNKKRRTLQYWFIDGISEVTIGVLFGLLGLYFFVETNIPHATPLAAFLDVSLVFVILGSGFLARRIIQAFKARITYPRTGYVAYKRPRGIRRWIPALVGLAIGSLGAAFFANAPASLDWMPAITGFLFSVIWLVIAHRVGLTRLYLMVVFSPPLGMILSLAGLGEYPGMAVFYALSGLVLFISGGATLWTYLHHTEPTTREALDE